MRRGRDRGRAHRRSSRPPAPTPTAIATALLDLNDRTLERLVHAPADFDWDEHVEAVVHIWLASIYGRTA